MADDRSRSAAVRGIGVVLVAAALPIMVMMLRGGNAVAQMAAAAGAGDPNTSGLTFSPPALDAAPEHLRDAVKLGFNILHETHKYAPAHVGNKLDCTNCHFDAGRVKDTLSLVGVAATFPKYSTMKKEPIDLATITNMCFERYLNAKPLPQDSKEMTAILAYYQWISKGIPIYADVPWLGLEPIHSDHKPDKKHGEEIFQRCKPCHGDHGQGLLPSGAPPLWGDGAFPAGPGMGQEDVLAAFVHRFMPKGDADLTVPQALDVAAFVLSHPRPELRSAEKQKGTSGK